MTDAPGGFVTSIRRTADAASRRTTLQAPNGPAALMPEWPDRALPTFPVPASAAEIAGRLAQIEVADVGAFDLVEVAAGWAQVIAIAIAYQAQAVGEMLARDTGLGDGVDDELACALVMTGRSAQIITSRAAGIVEHPLLGDALRAGTLDARKVDVILEETVVLDDADTRAEVVALAAEAGAGLTAPQLVRYIRRLVLTVDPASSKERAKRARRERSVELKWINDSMASISALLPAADAVAAFTAIDALAGHVGGSCGVASPNSAGWANGGADADGTAGADGAGWVRDDRTIDQRRADAFAAVFNGILDSGRTPDGTPVPTRHGKRTSLQVTVGAGTLLGLDDLPGELAGYGPIPADLARELALDATWRRILTDPSDGTFVERGRVTYRPGADLSGTVLARDVTCAFPGCQQPAPRCEIDHVEPFDPDRPAEHQTTAQNLQALCKHHHQLKTRRRWNASRDPVTGNAVWTSPAGITYARSPIPIHLSPAQLQHVGPRRPAPPRPDPDDPPPF